MITITQHRSSSYAPRTYHNARIANLTLAFAFDFTTAGEKLTRKAAAFTYVAVIPGVGSPSTCGTPERLKGPVVNIAGNGIYTAAQYDATQDDCNLYVYRYLKELTGLVEVCTVRSGGQTGFDLAGLVAGHALGLDVEGLMPAGYRYRDAQGVDRRASPTTLALYIEYAGDALRQQP